MPELRKDIFTRCRHQSVRGCAIYGDPERPFICRTYECAWLMSQAGEEADRPDLCGAMFSLNRTERGRIGFAIEIRPDAMVTTARVAAVDFARRHEMPLIVSEYGKATAGEWVVIHDDLTDKASAILGPVVARLSPDVAMYERREPVMQP